MMDFGPSIGVDGVIIPAAELAQRPSRQPDHAAEARALASLAEAMATSPETVLQRLVEVVLELTASDSAGVSILEQQDGAPLLRWHAIAGAYAANLNGTMPPAASPCGTVMARNQVLLFNEAERVFPDLREAKPRIYENLLAPFEVEGRPAGTVWAIKHTPEGRFEPEDARLLARLAHVASAAYQMTTALAEAQQGRKALERRVEARTRELTRANECLAASEKRFRRVMGIGTVGALFFNLNGRMTDANAAFERMSGYSRDELIACEHWETLTPPEFREATARAAAELAERGETEPYEKQMIRKDGSRWWGLFAPTRLSGSGPEAECFEFIIDITERKRAEEAWRRFATLAESSSEFIGMCDMRLAPFYVNAAGLQLVGLDGLEHARRTPVLEFFFPEDRALIRDEFLPRVLRNGRGEIETRFRHFKTGAALWVIYSVVALADEHGRPVGYGTVTRDITKRKRAEEALRASEERLRLIVESARDYAIFTTDPQDRITDWMPGAAAVYGWSAEQVVGRPGAVLFTPEDREAGVPAQEIETARREGIAPNVRWHVRKDGARVFIEGSTRALRGPDGSVRGFLKIGQDVTERRRAEEALRASEERFQHVARATRDIVWDIDLVADRVWWSEALWTELGFAAEDVEPDTAWCFTHIHPEDRERVVRGMREAIEGTGDRWSDEFLYRRADGSYAHIVDRGFIVRDAQGRALRMIGAMRDITHRKRAEAALRASEHRLADELSGAKTLQRISTELIPEQRPEALYGQALDAAMALMRSDAASVQILDPKGTHLRLLASRNFHPDSEAFWQRVDAGSASTCGQALQRGTRVVVPDVETCDVIAGTRDLDAYRRSGLRAVQSTPLISRDGRSLGMISTLWRRVHEPASGDFDLFDILARQAADLIERAQTEAALHESEARLRLAQEVTGIGTWEWDPETGENLWLPEKYALFGLDPARDGPMTFRRVLDEIVHPDDRAKIETALREALATGEPYECVFRAGRRRPDGEWESCWLIARGRRIPRADGSPGRMLGVTVDITERQDTEARLQQLQAELLHVSRLSAAGEMAAALAHELNQPLTAISSAVEGALQVLRTAASGAPGREAVPAMALEAMDLAAKQALRAGQIIRRLRDFVSRGEADQRLQDTRKLIEEAGALALVGTRESGIQASFHLAPQLPPVLVDRIQIQQVLLNLIRNAVEAMTQEGAVAGDLPRRELVVAAVPTGAEEVEISVADTGPGLPAEVASRLFEPFVTTKPGGMGVGLSICRTIVEAHGGRFWAEPMLGGGTVFRFTLPAALSDPVA